MADCGCKIKSHSNFRGEVQSRSIEFCALHANAEKMRAVAKKLDELDWVIGYELTGAQMQILDEALTAARAVLAETGGE